MVQVSNQAVYFDVRPETRHVGLELSSDFGLEEGEVILRFRRACALRRVGALRGMMYLCHQALRSITCPVIKASSYQWFGTC